MTSAAGNDTNDERCIESFSLALHPNHTLWMSLHLNVKNPHDLFVRLRDHPRLAMINVNRLVSTNQLVAAANMALFRDKGTKAAWDTVYCAAGSTHAGHVWRDYSFGDESFPLECATIVVLGLDKNFSLENYESDLKELALDEPQSIEKKFAGRKNNPEEVANFRTWYKVTQDEIDITSVEQAVLTRISTKFYV